MADLDELLKDHEPSMRLNAEKCVKTNNIHYFIACYVEACTPGGKVALNKYSDLFTRQYFLEKDDGVADELACVEALIYTGMELLSYDYNKRSSSV